jgi:ATP phosphoribosyltransferase
MRLAVPNKGRLHDPALDLLDRAGLGVEHGADRRLYAETVDPEITVVFARAADIPQYVADGAADAGVTGLDQVRESGHDLADLLDLEFGRCRLVLAAPEDGPVDAVADLADATVATEFPAVTRGFFADTAVTPTVIEVSGATELTPHVEMADAIVDITSTGTTLRVNRLAEVAEVLSSSVRLFARPETRDDPKVQQTVTALRAVLAAEDRRYLMLNAPEENLDEIKAVTPGMGGPTVLEVDEPGVVAVHAVVAEREIFEAVAALKEAGAEDILVTEIERLVE